MVVDLNFRIVVPFDISDYSKMAAHEAIRIAKSLDGSAIFIHIVEPDPYHGMLYTSPSPDVVVENEIDAIANKWFAEIIAKSQDPAVQTEMHLIYDSDSVSQTIIEYAKKVNADLIVIGHHHYTHGFGKWMGPHIAKDLIDNAPCSVLVALKG